MPTSVKLLNKLKDEDLEKVYNGYLEVRFSSRRGGPVPWREYVQIFGREKALSALTWAVNNKHPADSRVLWLISTLVLCLAILTSIFL